MQVNHPQLEAAGYKKTAQIFVISTKLKECQPILLVLEDHLLLKVICWEDQWLLLELTLLEMHMLLQHPLVVLQLATLGAEVLDPTFIQDLMDASLLGISF